MVRGKRQAIDSAYIKANASLDSLIEKQIIEDAQIYSNELNDNSEFKVTAQKKKDVEQHHAWKKRAYKDMPGHGNDNRTDEDGNLIRPKFLSNHTHYSPTDPDARISVKPGKARQLNYSGQIAVDDAHHVITGAVADHADKRDSQSLPKILDQTIHNLKEENITIEQIAADAGYSSGESLCYIEQQNIDAYIPNFGQYRSEREGFLYNKEQDRYECTRGNRAMLPFKGISTDSKGYTKKTYRSSESICKNCPLREACCGKTTKFKKIDDSIQKPYYDRMHAKLTGNKVYARRMSKIRSKTVEPVLGTLINFMNMKRINTRGIKNANKHVLMAALCYNLKKYMKFIQRKTNAKVAVMHRQLFLSNYSITCNYLQYKR